MLDKYLPMEEFQPTEKFIIRDLEALKVVADPLRVQLLESLSLEPLTVKELADRLGLAASKLYYHLKLLEEHSLIQVVATRIVSGIIEKQYRATADNLEIDKELLSFRTDDGKANLTSLVNVTFDAAREDMLRSLHARTFNLEQGAAEQPRQMTFIRDLAPISEARAEEFHQRLRALMQEFKTAGEPISDAISDTPPTGKPQLYALMLALYPTFYFDQDGNSGELALAKPRAGTQGNSEESSPS
jgi:DNA-binding transcriptional ArsR family regulator